MSRCDQFPTLLRRRDAGQSDAVGAHLQTCEECAAAWADLEALTSLGRALPENQPTDARRENVRTRLLAQAGAPTVSRDRRRLLAAAAVLIMGVAAWHLWPLPPQEASGWAQVTPSAGAHFQRHRTVHEETVVLRDGVIAVYVSTLAADQRVRVLTVDAEVEVRGTRLSVAAVNGRLQTVEVVSGRVTVRPREGPTVHLEGGDRWTAPREIPPPSAAHGPASDTVRPSPSFAPRPTPAPRPPARRVSATPPVVQPESTSAPAPAPIPVAEPATPPSPQTLRFEAGWTALRGGKPNVAVDAFDAAASLPGPLVADAHWWRAVALGRAGRDGETLVALNRYLAAYPTSTRRAEASVMLGWLHFAAGRMDAAEAAFRAGVGARRGAVERRAKEGLEAVTEWRKEAR